MAIGSRRSRLLLGFAAGLVGVALLLTLGIAAALWATLPASYARLRIPHLSAPVTVSFDTLGVPRIRAASAIDAATALGYLHARDRMFQMDLMRRTASGRLSEFAGSATLPMDKMFRILGLRRRALADDAALSPEMRALLDAYARGVNAWIARRGRFAAPEYLLLGAPEPWTRVDTLLWGRMMGLWLSGNWRTELDRYRLLGKVPVPALLSLWPPSGATPGPEATTAQVRFGAAESVARPVSVAAGRPDRPATLRVGAVPGFPNPFSEPDEASDEWAVDGRHSATGAPLLAGDPHLALAFPAPWYLARIDTPGHVLAGATAPGVPFLVLGRNADIGWSFTTTGADTEDVFVETVLPGGRYLTPDGPRPFASREERIRVRGAPDTLLTVRQTRHGPVISDLWPGAPGAPVLAVAMENLLAGDAAAGLLALNQARDVTAAGAAAAAITAPVQNLLVADRHRIAMFTTGRVPVRRSGDGSLPVSGADGSHDWIGSALGGALPVFVAPMTGRLVNGNERTAPPDFPVFLGRDFPLGWRAQRIRALLDAPAAPDVARFAAMQADEVSSFAQTLLPRLAALRMPPGLAARAQGLLAGWHGDMAADLPQPLIFNAWMQRFAAVLLARAGIPEEAGGIWEDFTAWVLVAPPTGHPGHPRWWCGGDCSPLLARALEEATAALARRFGDDPAAWRWGSVHEAVFAHPLFGAMPLLRALAARQIRVPGDDTTLFRGGDSQLGGFAARHGAAYRGVYDLADLDRSRFIVTPGQSGNILSAHAWDLMQRWADGGSITLGPAPERLKGMLRLLP